MSEGEFGSALEQATGGAGSNGSKSSSTWTKGWSGIQPNGSTDDSQLGLSRGPVPIHVQNRSSSGGAMNAGGGGGGGAGAAISAEHVPGLTTAHMDLIWAVSVEQGEDRTLVVYKLIKDLALYLPAALMDRLVHNVEALAPHQVTVWIWFGSALKYRLPTQDVIPDPNRTSTSIPTCAPNCAGPYP